MRDRRSGSGAHCAVSVCWVGLAVGWLGSMPLQLAGVVQVLWGGIEAGHSFLHTPAACTPSFSELTRGGHACAVQQTLLQLLRLALLVTTGKLQDDKQLLRAGL